MRIVFFGTPQFAVPTLDALVGASGCSLLAVVCQPDRPAGRGRRVVRPPVALRADELGLPVLQPERARDPVFGEALAALHPDLAVVVAYGEIFPGRLLEIPRLSFYNLHASLLPRHRGPSPVAAAILAGDALSGVTFFRLVPRMDAGPVLARRSTPVGPRETAGSLHDRLALLGAELVADCARALCGPAPPKLRAQDESQATYCKLLVKADGRIDWSAGSREIDRRLRAMTPWPGPRAVLESGGRSVELTLVEARPADHPRPAGAVPGELLAAGPETLLVATGDGVLEIGRVLPAGRREMAVADYLRGHPLAAGSRFA